MKHFVLLICFFALPMVIFAQHDTTKSGSALTREMLEAINAEETADSVARAELAQYQKAHRGRLTRSQLNLSAYKRSSQRFVEGKSYFYVFDYDYNLPVGGVVYLLHFTVTVSSRTGRTGFKTL